MRRWMQNRLLLAFPLAVVAGACGAKTGLLPGDSDGASNVDDGSAGLTGRGGVAGTGGVAGAGGVALAAMSGAGAGVGGAGSAVGGGGGPGTVNPACMPTAISDPLVNDFENGEVNFTSPSGIPQNWSPGSILGEERMLVFEPPSPPRPGSSSSLAIKLQGLGRSGVINVLYHGCFALPPARAIRFYIQATSSPSPLVVRADTRATSPVKSGGTCDDCTANITTVMLVSGWQEVEIPFERFTGGTYSFEANDQLGFSFQWSSGNQVPIPYELWLDDVTYVF